MRNLRIRELIESFCSDYVPQQVRSSFASWILGKEDADVKEDALEEIWDEMSLEKERFGFDELVPSADDVLSDARSLETPEREVKLRRYRRMTAAFAAVAVVCIVCCVYFTLKQPRTTMVLVASNVKTFYELPDGSSVWLNRGSRLSYDNNLNGKCRRLHLDGEACFDVKKDAGHPFIVSTSNMDVKVLGTRFTLSAYSDAPEQVFLESGMVSLSSSHFSDDVLSPGEAFSYDPVSGSVSHYEEKAVNHLSWKNEQLEFANVSLDEIVTNLEHWYNVRIEINGMPAEERLSLIVRQEPVQEILAAIQRLTGRSFTINGNEITLN